MTLQAITLMEAYIIENLRKNGVSDEEILKITDESIQKWEKQDDRFDYTTLKKLATNTGDQFSSIIQHGYKVKFLTLNGLINLVELKLGKKRDTDFTVHDDGIRQLEINEDEQKVIQQLLSRNWKMTKTGKGITIRSQY